MDQLWHIQGELSRAMEELKKLRLSQARGQTGDREGETCEIGESSQMVQLKLRAAEARVRALSARFNQIAEGRTTGELVLQLEEELREAERLLHEAEGGLSTMALSSDAETGDEKDASG